MRQRILAIVAAVALVVVAVVVRSMLADDGSEGADGGSRPVVACTPDLQQICDALVAEGRIAAGTDTLDLDDAAMTDTTIDGWITWDPAPGIANLDHPDAWDATEPFGEAPLAVATRSNDGLDLGTGCTMAGVAWRCFTDPKSLAIGVGTGTTSESLARIHPIAQAMVPDDGDFTDIPTSQLVRLVESPVEEFRGPFPDQLRSLLTAPGALQVLVGPQGALDAATGIDVARPKPNADVVAVLALRPDSDVGDTTDLFDGGRVAAAIRAAGLTPTSEAELAPPDRAGELYQVRRKVGRP